MKPIQRRLLVILTGVLLSIGCKHRGNSESRALDIERCAHDAGDTRIMFQDYINDESFIILQRCPNAAPLSRTCGGYEPVPLAPPMPAAEYYRALVRQNVSDAKRAEFRNALSSPANPLRSCEDQPSADWQMAVAPFAPSGATHDSGDDPDLTDDDPNEFRRGTRFFLPSLATLSYRESLEGEVIVHTYRKRVGVCDLSLECRYKDGPEPPQWGTRRCDDMVGEELYVGGNGNAHNFFSFKPNHTRYLLVRIETINNDTYSICSTENEFSILSEVFDW